MEATQNMKQGVRMGGQRSSSAMRLVANCTLLIGLAAGTTRADEPIAPPRPVPAEALPINPTPYAQPMPYRPSQYDVWQTLSVDRYGRWRPRVIYAPGSGAFYLYNGAPYPFTTAEPRRWMPYAGD